MKAFVLKLAELFKMNSNRGEDSNFNPNKRKLLIPVYQREYNWNNDRISALINDIRKRDKFLGNIILDEVDQCYEIVDGQQRLTTCILTLAVLYNKYHGHPMEQSVIEGYIKPYGEVILQNNSIKDYLTEVSGLMKLQINPDDDIYSQRSDFERAITEIQRMIETLSSFDELNEFKQKLLNCKLLILINDDHEYTRSVEQLFLDINEKAQLLKVEDIFKGHCFEKYDISQHENLKSKWVQLKKNAAKFKDFSFDDASQYIYLYLLETESTNIPENLTVAGKHYLENKTTDDIDLILNNMISFGDAVCCFYNNIKNSEYRFIDICQNSLEYQYTNDHIVLKQMASSMLDNSNAIYQKLPFMYLVYVLKNNGSINSSLLHKDFRKIITNLYVYMNLFVLSGAKKSKKEIDRTVRIALEQPEPISELIVAAKQLRVDKVAEFEIQNAYSFDKLAFLYSVLDNYVANDNWITNIYSRTNNHNLEHFIIPDQRNRKIKWVDGEFSFDYVVPSDTYKKGKKRTINQLVIDKNLNESLNNFDVVYKIQKIKEWYITRELDIPKHISVFLNYIESVPEYNSLKTAKENHYDEEAVIAAYNAFLNVYFNAENNTLSTQLIQEFVNVFRNDPN